MKIKKISQFIFPFLLFLISLIPLLDLLHPGLPLTHDGKDHVARIANFYQNLAEGIIVPRWAENLNWGYGHPILMFLYPLPSYSASLFHFLGLSFVDSTKLVMAVGFVFSGLAMYLWLQAFLPKYAAFFGGLLYMFAPYRFVDMYVRGDIGENLAFIFTPLVLYFLFRLSKNVLPTSSGGGTTKPRSDAAKQSHHDLEKRWGLLHHFVPCNDTIWGAFALAGLILAHNAIALMFLPMILFYAVYLFLIPDTSEKNRKFFMIHVCSLLILGFALAAFFWAPALLEGKYTLRDIVTAGEYASRFVSFPALVYGPWNYGQTGQFTQQLGILQWLALLAAPFAFFRLRKAKGETGTLIAALVIYNLVAIFFMLPISNILWQHFMLLQNFQFPWRFLAITVFATAVLGAISLSLLPKKMLLYATIILSLGALIITYSDWHANGYSFKPESYYTGIYYGTTDTGESAPIWSVRFMEHTPKAHMEVLQGTAKISEQKRISVLHSYAIVATNDVRVRENTLYFPGWQVLIDGKMTPIQFQDPNNRGIMTFMIPPGKHQVLVQFTETKLRLIADYVSLLALIFVIFCAVFVRRKMG